MPIGNYYVQEINANAAYIASETKYPVNFEYAGQDTALVNITANGAKPLGMTLSMALSVV